MLNAADADDDDNGGVMVPKVLVVDDEPALVDVITYNLKAAGFAVVSASDADEALRIFRSEHPDVVVLDVMLPSGSGFDVCRLIRQSGSRVPILMLTARIAESDRVHGLEIGADDYVLKPFANRELIARIKALIRRSSQSGDAPSSAPLVASAALGLTLDAEKREAVLGSDVLKLSRKEFDLLITLCMHPGRVFDRATLLERVWGAEASVDERTVDVHIRWLREKVEPEPSSPVHLLTVRGVGYKFQP
jgi:DNA-binding response OmpR family regulator